MAKRGKFGIAEDDFDPRNLLGETEKKVAEANEKNIPEKELKEELKEKLVYLTDSQLVDDPYNETYYRAKPEEIKWLAESMRIYGFRGVIVAYPIGKGKYRIESGHRRRAAAKLAGIKKYPVYVTEAPATDWERRLHLFAANLNDRKDNATPIDKAMAAQGLFDAIKDKIQDLKTKGALEEGAETRINYLVAEEMHEDHATVERLRALLKLIPELQKLVDTGLYSWVALSSASPLDEDNQMLLYEAVVERTKAHGAEAVTKAWLQRIIRQIKDGEYHKEARKRGEKVDVKEPPRRRYGAKAVVRGITNVRTMLDGDDSFRKEELPEVIDNLKKLRESLDAKLKVLEIQNSN